MCFRILVVKAVDVGQDYQQVGVRQLCHRGGKRVVVADVRADQLVDGHGVVFVDHRDDPQAQQRLKENWKATEKLYLAIVRGHLPQRQGIFSSYLAENEDLYVYSVDDPAAGKLSQTEYAVIKETAALSAVKIRLLTGRKNQIRVHFAEAGHPVAGDPKYGTDDPFRERLCLHAKSIAFDHPHTGRRLFFGTPIPEVFARLVRGLTEDDWDAAMSPPPAEREQTRG